MADSGSHVGRPAILLTAVVMKPLFVEVVEALLAAGVTFIHYTSARNTLYGSLHSNWFRLGRQPSLIHDAVELIYVLIRPRDEQVVMQIIADQARLDLPGMGSLFCQDVVLLKSHPLFREVEQIDYSSQSQGQYSHELMGVVCTVTKGEGDNIARLLLEMGISVPTISYGMGTGLRDKLGLLRIAIPADKETLHFLVSRYDAEHVFERLIQEGKLNQPGRGFINLFPVRKGRINTKLSHGRSGQAASIDQIVSAIDELKGNIVWRRADHFFTDSINRQSFHGLDLTLLTSDLREYDLVRQLLDAGVTGATISKLKLIESEEKTGISRARVACNMIVDETELGSILTVLDDADAYSDEAHSMVFVSKAEKVYTYWVEKD